MDIVEINSVVALISGPLSLVTAGPEGVVVSVPEETSSVKLLEADVEMISVKLRLPTIGNSPVTLRMTAVVSAAMTVDAFRTDSGVDSSVLAFTIDSGVDSSVLVLRSIIVVSTGCDTLTLPSLTAVEPLDNSIGAADVDSLIGRTIMVV